MPRCYNCGVHISAVETIFNCAVASCRNEIFIPYDENLEKKNYGFLKTFFFVLKKKNY